MSFLRTSSTRRLLAMLIGLVVAIAGGSAIAVAASSGGPVLRAEPLASAVRGALTAPSVPGVIARVTLTNHLIDASNIQGSDPLLQGASGRLWLSPSTHQLRLELQSDNGDAQAVLNNGSFWVYDPSSRTVYRGTLPAQAADTSKPKKTSSDTVPSLTQIQSQLGTLAQHLNLSGAIPTDVAGHAAYSVQLSPKHDGGLLGDAQLAWDALRGAPLRVAIYARGDRSPVLELKATHVSFGQVPSSDFNVTPPSGSKLVQVSTAGASHGARQRSHRAETKGARAHEVTGAAAVASQLPFPLLAPSSLVGLPRQSVKLLDWSGSPAALVTYGQNLGGIAVIEQRASSAGKLGGSSQSSDHGPGLSLPTVSINGATGQELNTALGTVVRFTGGNVAYTVLGSVPPAAAEAAARAL